MQLRQTASLEDRLYLKYDIAIVYLGRLFPLLLFLLLLLLGCLMRLDEASERADELVGLLEKVHEAFVLEISHS